MTCFLFPHVTNTTISFLAVLPNTDVSSRASSGGITAHLLKASMGVTILWHLLSSRAAITSAGPHTSISFHDRRCHTHSVVVELIYVNEILLMNPSAVTNTKSIRHTASFMRLLTRLMSVCGGAGGSEECAVKRQVSYSVLCCSRHSINTHLWKSCSSAGTTLALWKTHLRDFTGNASALAFCHYGAFCGYNVFSRLLSTKEKL